MRAYKEEEMIDGGIEEKERGGKKENSRDGDGINESIQERRQNRRGK